MALDSPAKPPDNWTMLTPDGLKAKAKCPNCMGHPRVTKRVEEWSAKVKPIFPESETLPGKLLQLSRALYVIERGAVGATITSDLHNFDVTQRRLVQDKTLETVMGLEYHMDRLTLDSYHFIYRRNKIIEGNPCMYRLRKSMKPVINVGVKCKQTIVPRKHGQTVAEMYPLTIDDQAPPIFTSIPRFSIVDFSDVFFDYEALWAMFVSIIPKGDPSEAWSIWVQRMVQEIGAEVALTSLPCPDRADLANVTPDLPTEIGAGAFRKIQGWHCRENATFYQCGISLAEFILNGAYVDAEDVRLLRLWFEYLEKTDYPQPVRKPLEARVQDVVGGCVIHNPSLQVRVLNVPREEVKTPPRPLFPAITPLCQNITYKDKESDPFQLRVTPVVRSIQDIVLVVIFYGPAIYGHVKYLEDIYSNYFRHRIYCGPDPGAFHAVYKGIENPVNFIESQFTGGFMPNQCMDMAVMMNFGVKGYLEVSDDVVLNSWTLKTLPRDKFWFGEKKYTAGRAQKKVLDLVAPNTPTHWWWPWIKDDGKWGWRSMEKIWKIFENTGSPGEKQIFNNFKAMLSKNTGSPDLFYYAGSDIFYVPALHRPAWTVLSTMFDVNNLFLEIAVPTMIFGLVPKEEVFTLQGSYLWYGDHKLFAQAYRANHTFLHAWKLTGVGTPEGASFFCGTHLPNNLKGIEY